MYRIALLSNKFLLIILVVAFAVISIFGLWNHYNMEMNGTETADTCSFVAQPCDMNLREHIAMWQSFFTAPNISYLTYLLLIAAFILSYFIIPKPKQILKAWHYLKHNFVISFNYLIQAFSQGILNPKVY